MPWLVGAVAFVLMIAAAWRLSSTRRSIPCPAWLSWLVELDNPVFRNNRAAAIVAGLEMRPGMSALDAGCGPGRLTLPMARAVGPSGSIVAFDLQPGMLAKVEARARAAGLDNVNYLQGALGPAALEPGAFDRAVLVTVLGEIPDQAAALGELFAALKPQGVLAITEVIADPHFQRRSHVIRLAQAAGFRERRTTGWALSYTLYLEKPSVAQAT